MADIDKFFEHHGVLGQHWGLHKPAVATMPKKKKEPIFTTKQKVQIGVGIGATAAFIAGKIIIAKSLATPVGSLPIPRKSASDFVKMMGETDYSDILKAMGG